MATVFNHEPAVSQHANVLPIWLSISLNFLGLELLLDAHLWKQSSKCKEWGVLSPPQTLPQLPSPFPLRKWLREGEQIDGSCDWSTSDSVVRVYFDVRGKSGVTKLGIQGAQEPKKEGWTEETVYLSADKKIALNLSIDVDEMDKSNLCWLQKRENLRCIETLQLQTLLRRSSVCKAQDSQLYLEYWFNTLMRYNRETSQIESI